MLYFVVNINKIFKGAVIYGIIISAQRYTREVERDIKFYMSEVQ